MSDFEKRKRSKQYYLHPLESCQEFAIPVTR